MGAAYSDSIIRNGLKILLLGSYDKETKPILRNLRKILNEKFERYVCTTVLLENIDIHKSSIEGIDIQLFIEKEDSQITMTIVRNGNQILERLDVDESEFSSTIGEKSKLIDYTKFRKLNQLEKVGLLNEWADIAYTIKHNELTRGGELVELTYILFTNAKRANIDAFKYNIFFQSNIVISSMLEEIVKNFRIDTISYTDYPSLEEMAIQTTRNHIARLNVTIGRFTQFE